MREELPMSERSLEHDDTQLEVGNDARERLLAS
jgi:hypothetical protein